jgi:hypothetical protein
LDFGFNCLKKKENGIGNPSNPRTSLRTTMETGQEIKNWTTLVHTHDPYNILTIIDTTSIICENGIHLDTHTKHMRNIFLQRKEA